MSIRYLLIVVISLGSIVTDSAFAVDQQGLDQFKESIIETIYTDPEFLPLIDVEQAQIELSDLSKSFEQLQGEYSRIDEYKGELEEKYGDIQVTIEYIISDTDRTKQALAESLTQISVLGRKIASLKDALELLQQDLEESISYAETYARFLYKIGNDYFGSDLEISDLKLLVRSENIAQTLSSDDLVQLLMLRLNELLTTIEEKQRLYLTYTLQLNKARVTYQRGVEYYSEELVRLQEQELHLYELMSYLQEDLARAQQKVQEIEASRQQLDKQISTIQQATSQRQLVNEGSPVYKLLNKDDRDDGDRYFTWPVLPFDEVEYYYQDPYYLQEKGSPMQGVYINLPQWRGVYAPAPGIVYKIHQSDDLSLSWLVLIHKYWYITMFSPLSEIYVKEWELVQRGKLLGASGWQPGTNWAGLDSAQPHLLFEVMKNGDYVDPYFVLDLSIFENKEELPAQYQRKYLQDFFAREVDLSQVTYQQWTTLDARRDAFLRTYAPMPYTDPSLWYRAAHGTKVKPILGICIAFAETSFKHFKSQNNIGNVGNNDRGQTVTFDTPYDGVRALYQVLNNEYLSQYYTLNQLSRYGNRDGYIYASSSYNRQKNIMTCLSSIYGYPVPEDFPFRMAK